MNPVTSSRPRPHRYARPPLWSRPPSDLFMLQLPGKLRGHGSQELLPGLLLLPLQLMDKVAPQCLYLCHPSQQPSACHGLRLWGALWPVVHQLRCLAAKRRGCSQSPGVDLQQLLHCAASSQAVCMGQHGDEVLSRLLAEELAESSDLPGSVQLEPLAGAWSRHHQQEGVRSWAAQLEAPESFHGSSAVGQRGSQKIWGVDDHHPSTIHDSASSGALHQWSTLLFCISDS